MKKVICILVTAVLFNTAMLACRAAGKTIKVGSAQEFIEAIGSNRTLILTDSFNITEALADSRNDKLLLSSEAAEKTNKKVFYVEEFDGPELHIANVENLTIEAGQDIVVIASDPRYANVISFDKCVGLTIKGITFGHTEEGYCSQGVLGFTSCGKVFLDRCDLYGCGTEGIIVSECKDIKFKATKIRDCSYYIMHVGQSSDVTFDSCQFFRNREFEQVNIWDCKNVLFDNCIFANNTGELFNVTCPVTFRDCVVLHDSMFWGDDSYIEYINCITEEYFHSEQALGAI